MEYDMGFILFDLVISFLFWVDSLFHPASELGDKLSCFFILVNFNGSDLNALTRSLTTIL